MVSFGVWRAVSGWPYLVDQPALLRRVPPDACAAECSPGGEESTGVGGASVRGGGAGWGGVPLALSHIQVPWVRYRIHTGCCE
jgi:hypothetical protein